jgi:hypothetical protein
MATEIGWERWLESGWPHSGAAGDGMYLRLITEPQWPEVRCGYVSPPFLSGGLASAPTAEEQARRERPDLYASDRHER